MGKKRGRSRTRRLITESYHSRKGIRWTYNNGIEYAEAIVKPKNRIERTEENELRFKEIFWGLVPVDKSPFSLKWRIALRKLRREIKDKKKQDKINLTQARSAAPSPRPSVN